ncbi:hypothetical protein Gorai_002916 [Gossypium raimondii]|uniref:Reverse transcriptase domain-containing protein n=1 Tax=Gossypium raimondii TaxID=29730 RepID=A0A7J8QNH9_GOSRA|nr:hypothetical protein [Gossypium raimondii]
MGMLPPNSFPNLDNCDSQFLGKEVSNDEIKATLFYMALLKAPGGDGFQALSFQKQWDLIGLEICEWVKEVFDGKSIEPELKNTLLVLIPKVPSPKNFSQLRPIILCSVMYKLVAGIPNMLINVIMSVITNSTMKVLWNGAPTQKFKLVRGIHQGCPLSPYLFILCMVWSGHSFHHAIGDSLWWPIRLSRSGPSLSYIFFVDDLVIFGHAGPQQILVLRDILERFYGFQRVHNLSTYLGIPLLHERILRSTLRLVIDKIHSKLNRWDAKKLSIAGRATLAQSVLLSIPNYFMQSMMISKGLSDEIEHIVRGHGIRHLTGQNTSFVMKIRHNLVSKKNSLWVRVLRSKYGMKEALPNKTSRGNCSALWSVVSKMQALLDEISGLFFIGDLIKWLKANLQSPAKSDDGEEDVSRREEQISVFQAPTSLISLCTDGAVQIASENAAARGAIMNVNGEWILGYNRNLGKCSIFDAELWGKLDGLTLTQNMS